MIRLICKEAFDGIHVGGEYVVTDVFQRGYQIRIDEGGEYVRRVYLFEVVNDKGKKQFYDSTLFDVVSADSAVYNGDCEDWNVKRGRRYFIISEGYCRTLVADDLFWSSWCDTDALSGYRTGRVSMKSMTKVYLKD